MRVEDTGLLEKKAERDMSSAGLKQCEQRKIVEVESGGQVTEGKAVYLLRSFTQCCTLQQHFVKSISVAFFHQRIQSDHSGKQYSS